MHLDNMHMQLHLSILAQYLLFNTCIDCCSNRVLTQLSKSCAEGISQNRGETFSVFLLAAITTAQNHQPWGTYLKSVRGHQTPVESLWLQPLATSNLIDQTTTRACRNVFFFLFSMLVITTVGLALSTMATGAFFDRIVLRASRGKQKWLNLMELSDLNSQSQALQSESWDSVIGLSSEFERVSIFHMSCHFSWQGSGWRGKHEATRVMFS